MTFIELLKEIFESSKQRTKSPITGAYITSFTIWNWKPILFLIFENTTISNKIIIINAEYSTYLSILGPLIITLIYVLFVPFLSMSLDRVLIVTKKANLKSMYQEKIYDTQEKIALAKEEIKLQDVISRKLEVEELLEQIDSLKSKIKDDDDTNKAIINDYKSQIFELTSLLNSQNESKNINNMGVQFNRELIKSYSLLSSSEREDLKKIPISIDSPIPSNLNAKVVQFLNKNGCTVLNDGFVFLSKKGIEFLLLLQDKN